MFGKLSMVLGIHAIISIVLMIALWSQVQKWATEQVGTLIGPDDVVEKHEQPWSVGYVLILNCVGAALTATVSLITGIIAFRLSRKMTRPNWPARVGVWSSSTYGLIVLLY